MGRDLVIWSGPVAPYQVPGATVPGAEDHFIGCVGDVQEGKAHCPSLANSWLDGSGRRLPRLLQNIGYDEATAGNIYLGSFSAGGSIVKRLLEHPADRARIKAVMLADASYSSGGTAANPEPVEGYVRYALDLLDDPTRFFLATASASPNKQYGSGEQVLDATRREIERRSGRTLTEGGAFPISDQPEHLYTGPRGNILFADYGMKGGGHRYHPEIAPSLWQSVLVPWLGGAQPPPGSPPPGLPGTPPSSGWGLETAIVFLLGAGAGYYLMRKIDS